MLVEKIKTGDPRAQTEFYNQYYPLILSCVLEKHTDISKEDAEEITNDTFVEAYQSINQVTDGSVGAWLRKIAQNNAIDFIRARDCRPDQHPDVVSIHDLEVYEEPTYEPDYDLISPFQIPYGGALSETECLVIYHHELNGHTCREIGNALGLTDNNVRQIRHRAKKKLRDEKQRQEWREKGERIRNRLLAPLLERQRLRRIAIRYGPDCPSGCT